MVDEMNQLSFTNFLRALHHLVKLINELQIIGYSVQSSDTLVYHCFCELHDNKLLCEQLSNLYL